jgi:hypothetical protein
MAPRLRCARCVAGCQADSVKHAEYLRCHDAEMPAMTANFVDDLGVGCKWPSSARSHGKIWAYFKINAGPERWGQMGSDGRHEHGKGDQIQ